MRCHASGELFLGGLWAGIAVRRLVRPANPTRLQYLRLGLWQFLAANRTRYAPDQALGALVSLQIAVVRSEEHTSELQSLMRISYAVFCLKKKKQHAQINIHTTQYIYTQTTNDRY